MPDLRRQREPGSHRHRRLAFGVATVVLVADQVSKLLAVDFLAGGPVHLVGGIHLRLLRNYAGPGGNFAGHTILISLFTIVAVVALVAFIARSAFDRPAAVALGLFLGGALGNGFDRLLRAPSPLHGGVVDWLAPSAWGGSMNLADLSLNAALFVLLAGALLSLIPNKKRRRVDPDAAA